jgi:hypothetical protein
MNWRCWERKVSDPGLLQLIDYWQEKRGTRFAPPRKSIDPLDLGFVLGDVALLEVGREPLNFRYRLHGSNLVLRTHVDLTGRSIEEIRDPGFRNALREILTEIVQQRAPWVANGKESWTNGVGNFEAAMLPLSEDGESVSMIISCWRCLGYDGQPA